MSIWNIWKFVSDNILKLEVLIKDVEGKDEFRNIIRKKDNYIHGSAQQVIFILKEYGFNVEHTALPNKH